MLKTTETIIRYMQPEKGKYILCTWRLEGIPWRIIEDIRKWTDKNVHVEGARIWIKPWSKIGHPGEYDLNIKGRRHDDRCTWCESFRTALSTKVKEDMNCSVREIGGCIFD
jgi:hypothetical protein